MPHPRVWATQVHNTQDITIDRKRIEGRHMHMVNGEPQTYYERRVII